MKETFIYLREWRACVSHANEEDKASQTPTHASQRPPFRTRLTEMARQDLAHACPRTRAHTYIKHTHPLLAQRKDLGSAQYGHRSLKLEK